LQNDVTAENTDNTEDLVIYRKMPSLVRQKHCQSTESSSIANSHQNYVNRVCLKRIRVGRFLPEGGKNQFFPWKKVKTGPAKIVFAGKNRFLPEYIFLYFYYNKILLYCIHYLN